MAMVMTIIMHIVVLKPIFSPLQGLSMVCLRFGKDGNAGDDGDGGDGDDDGDRDRDCDYDDDDDDHGDGRNRDEYDGNDIGEHDVDHHLVHDNIDAHVCHDI